MNLADKTILNVFAKSSEAILLMISSIVMVRYFSKADYGTFLQILLITNTVIMLTFMGLPQSIYYFFPQVANRKDFVLRNVLLSLGIGIIASICIFSLKTQFAYWFNNPLLAQYGWVAPLLILLQAPSHFREPILISYQSLILNSIATSLCNIILFVPLISAAFFSVSLTVLLKVFIIASGVQFCLYCSLMAWVVYHIHHAGEDRSEHAASAKTIGFKEQLKYAFPLGISSYIGIIGQQMDQYIVSVFFTPMNFAVYSRGAMRIPVLSNIQHIVNDIMMPKYVSAYRSGDIKGFLKIFHTCIEKVAKINFPVFSFLFAVAPSIMTLLYTTEYIGSASILRAYLCLLLIYIAVYGIIPRASGKTACIMYATIIFVLSNVILSLLLIKVIGPLGAAIATIIAAVLASIYYLWNACKILEVSFAEIFPWQHLFQLFLTSLLASIPVYMIEYFSPAQGEALFVTLFLEGVVYGYGYVFFMMRKELIDNSDFETLTKWFRFDVQRFLQKITLLS